MKCIYVQQQWESTELFFVKYVFKNKNKKGVTLSWEPVCDRSNFIVRSFEPGTSLELSAIKKSGERDLSV